MSDMNPGIKTIKIGVVTLTERTIYPLSVANQLKTTKLIGDLIEGLSDDKEVEKLSDFAVVQKFTKAIESNIEEVLYYVSGGKDKPDNKISLDDLTNPQLSELIEIIFTENYESSIKNLKALWKRAQGLFLSEE